MARISSSVQPASPSIVAMVCRRSRNWRSSGRPAARRICKNTSRNVSLRYGAPVVSDMTNTGEAAGDASTAARSSIVAGTADSALRFLLNDIEHAGCGIVAGPRQRENVSLPLPEVGREQHRERYRRSAPLDSGSADCVDFLAHPWLAVAADLAQPEPSSRVDLNQPLIASHFHQLVKLGEHDVSDGLAPAIYQAALPCLDCLARHKARRILAT